MARELRCRGRGCASPAQAAKVYCYRHDPGRKGWAMAYRYRSAVTGRFITARMARRRPRTTVRERMPARRRRG